VDELVAFLRGCLDEDERVACAGGEAMDADNPSWPDYATYDGPDIDAAVAYLKQFRPARVLREVESKRRILDGHPFEQGTVGGVCGTCHGNSRMEEHWDGEEETVEWVDSEMVWPCPTVRNLAAVYSDRPGYREEWKP
jgi:hypothetical protein